MRKQVIRIGEICELKYGSSLPEQLRLNGEVPVYGSNGIVGFHNKAVTKGPSLIVGRKGSAGKVQYSDVPCFPIDTTYYIDTTLKDCNLKWLFYCLSFNNLSRFNKAAAVPGINRNDVYELEVTFPNLKEQNAIAEILEQADKARQQRKAANALTDQFLQSSFLSLFGDPVKNEKGWEVKTIGESDCKVQIGPFGTQLHAEDYIQGGIPLINPKHIQNMKVVEDNELTVSKEKYAELPNYHLQVGDIIMARRGEMARCALITDRENGWFCGTGSLYIRPSKEFDSTYLLYVLSSASIKERLENDAQGVTMANLNQTIINNLTLAIPPLSLQQQFAAIVAEAETLRKKQQESEQELEQLFQSLLQKYFG